MGHPYIMVGSPNTLQYLKKLGYRSYHPYINEGYDKIEDHGDRAIAIVDEIERLCNLKGAEFREWHSKVREIAHYNYRVLTGRNHLIKPINQVSKTHFKRHTAWLTCISITCVSA